MSTNLSRAEAEQLTNDIRTQMDSIRADIRDLESMGAFAEAAQAYTNLNELLKILRGGR